VSARSLAYDAAFGVLAELRDVTPRDVVHRNAQVWRAVEAALDAAGVPPIADPLAGPIGQQVAEHAASVSDIADAAPSAPASRTVRVGFDLHISDEDGKAVFSTEHLGRIGSVDRALFLAAVAEEFGVTIVASGPDPVPAEGLPRRQPLADPPLTEYTDEQGDPALESPC
jgi:hypothetical protein